MAAGAAGFVRFVGNRGKDEREMMEKRREQQEMAPIGREALVFYLPFGPTSFVFKGG